MHLPAPVTKHRQSAVQTSTVVGASCSATPMGRTCLPFTIRGGAVSTFLMIGALKVRSTKTLPPGETAPTCQLALVGIARLFSTPHCVQQMHCAPVRRRLPAQRGMDQWRLARHAPFRLHRILLQPHAPSSAAGQTQPYSCARRQLAAAQLPLVLRLRHRTPRR